MKKSPLLLVLIVFELTSCFNQIEFSNSEENREVTKRSIQEEAEIYISNMYIWDNIKMGRSIESKQKWPDFLSELNIVDVNDVPIRFDNFTEEEKTVFSNIWYETEVKILAESMETSKETLSFVENENNRIEKAKNKAFRSVDSNKQGNDFLKTYYKLLQKEYRKIENQKSARSGAGGSNMLTEADLNLESANYLGQIYKEGNVLIADLSSSSSTFYGGHAALMSKDKWNPIWIYTPFEDISISAWGDMGPDWPGKQVNKVQKEPLVYWAGKKNGCPKIVNIVKMQKQIWVWDWLNTGLKTVESTEEEAAEAVENARKWLGRGYAYTTLTLASLKTADILAGGALIIPVEPVSYAAAMAARYSEDEFYCSQLVWRAWYNVSSDYNIWSAVPLIPPEAFKEGASLGLTSSVGEYQNY